MTRRSPPWIWSGPSSGPPASGWTRYRFYYVADPRIRRLRIGRGRLDRRARDAGRPDARRPPRPGDRRPRLPLRAPGHGTDPRGSGRGPRRGLREVPRGFRPLHGRGVRATRLLGSTGRAGASGGVRPGRAQRGRRRAGAWLARAGPEPVLGPGDRPLRAAYADRIEFTLGGLDEEEIARRVDAAELDLVLRRQTRRSSRSPGTRDDPDARSRVFVHQSDVFWSVTMNLAVPPFDDVHVRRAVARAIDRAALVELLSEPPYGPFGFSWGEVATHVAPDALEGRLLRAFDPYPYDPEAARAGDASCPHYDRTRRRPVRRAGLPERPGARHGCRA